MCAKELKSFVTFFWVNEGSFYSLYKYICVGVFFIQSPNNVQIGNRLSPV